MGILSLFESSELLYKSKQNDETLAYAHLYQFFDIEVLIDIRGTFISAHPIKDKDEMTLIPSTICSEERSNNEEMPTPFGLHDTLIHVAGDYSKYFNITNTEHYELYLKQLCAWCDSGKANVYIAAILTYLQKGRLIQDIKYHINGVDRKSKVRFAIEISEDEIYKPWLDLNLINNYSGYYHDLIAEADKNAESFCYITGDRMDALHNAGRCYLPNMIFAKLFTKDDRSRIFTYKGRISTANEASWIGRRTSFTINYALRWLIKNRSKKIGDIYYVFFDQKFRTDWHIFNATKSILKAIGMSYDSSHIDFSEFEQQMLEIIGTDNKLICFGLGALTQGRLNVYEYQEYSGTDLKMVIHNIVLYHSKYRWRYGKLYSCPDLWSYIEATMGSQYIPTVKEEKVTRQRACPYIHDYVRAFMRSMLDAKPLPNFIVDNAVSYAFGFQRRKANQSNDWALTFMAACALTKGKINMSDEEILKQLDNWEDVQIMVGRLLAVLHWEDFRLYYYINMHCNNNTKQNVWTYKSLARQYMSEYTMMPYQTWCRLNLRLDAIERKLKVIGNDSQYYINLKSKLESALYSNDFAKLHHLDGRVLLGFEVQIYDFLSYQNHEIHIQNEEEENSNELEEQD